MSYTRHEAIRELYSNVVTVSDDLLTEVTFEMMENYFC